jgi:hypothetical protein
MASRIRATGSTFLCSPKVTEKRVKFMRTVVSLGISAVAALASGIGTPTDAIAQTSFVYKKIDCAASHLKVPFTPTTCRESNVVSGGANASGTFKRADVRAKDATGIYVVTMYGGDDPSSWIPVSASVRDDVGRIPEAKSGIDWTEQTAYPGGSYATFKSNTGEACAAMRKPGPYRGSGYAWVMWSVSCLPQGNGWTTASIQQFMAALGAK